MKFLLRGRAPAPQPKKALVVLWIQNLIAEVASTAQAVRLKLSRTPNVFNPHFSIFRLVFIFILSYGMKWWRFQFRTILGLLRYLPTNYEFVIMHWMISDQFQVRILAVFVDMMMMVSAAYCVNVADHQPHRSPWLLIIGTVLFYPITFWGFVLSTVLCRRVRRYVLTRARK
jgi:hypothetical protein